MQDMRRVFIIFSFIFISLLLVPTSARAQTGERISYWDSTITVKPDATAQVTEIIDYDFGNGQRHGIFRDIPLEYTNSEGKKFKIDFELQNVTQAPFAATQLRTDPHQSVAIEHEDEVRAEVAETRSSNNVRIRIGDPDAFVTGGVRYTIQYTVRGVITYFSDHDELFWNVTGNDWEVPIQNVEFRIENSEIAQGAEFICFTGVSGSTEKNCTVSFDEQNNQHVIQANGALPARSGLTVALSFPKGLVAVVEPQEAGKLTTAQIILFVVLAIGALLYYVLAPFYLIYRWYRIGRDPYVGKPVSAWFDPPKDKTGRPITPAELGVLVDERADPRDVSAMLVDLAIRGYIKIKEGKKSLLSKQEYTFELLKLSHATDKELQPFEKKLLGALFKSKNSTTTKVLSKTFYKDAKKIGKSLYESMEKQGFFPHNPEKVREKYYILGFVAMITGNIILAAFSFLFGRNMPRKTLFGAEKKVVGMGLKNFLTSQEKQLEFQAKNWHMFEQLLPYAIVFGVEKVWAKRFADLSVAPPDWYEGSHGRAFNTVMFTRSISSSVSRMSTVSQMSSSRSSSGFSSGFSGGSSGGGFGGGGGGSW